MPLPHATLLSLPLFSNRLCPLIHLSYGLESLVTQGLVAKMKCIDLRKHISDGGDEERQESPAGHP